MTTSVTAPVCGRRTFVLGGGLYLLVSLGLWWHTLAHLATVSSCGCGDAALTLWVLRWPAYAIAHGLNPFYSSRLLWPTGINMAPNSLGLGVGFAPVTWLFGPVATLNVIDIVSPVLSGIAMIWLLRRWGLRAPAVVLGGLFFAFSPFVLTSMALAHPNFVLLAPLPVIIGLLGDLVVTGDPRRTSRGVLLGLAITAEFLISVEVLALVALFLIFLALGLLAAAVIAPSTRPSIVARAGNGAPGLALSVAVSGVLLAYPLWSFFAGPAHLVGRAWPDSPPGTVATSPWDLVAGRIPEGLALIMQAFGGYQGPPLPSLGLLGIGIILVVVMGAVWFRSDGRLRLFVALAALAIVLSFGVVDGIWTPWRLFTRIPVFDNVVPVNLGSITALCVAIAFALVVDHVAEQNPWHQLGAWLLGAAAVVPVIVILAPNIPMTTQHVAAPRWFTTAATRLRAADVVLPYPAALGGIQSSMAWQTLAGQNFTMVGGGGPGITASRAGIERPGFDVLAAASLPVDIEPQPTPENLLAVRQALTDWGVTIIVVPDQPGLPSYDRGRPVPYAVAFFTAALGFSPAFHDLAWTWSVPRHLPAPIPLPAETFAHCGQHEALGPTRDEVAACVLDGR